MREDFGKINAKFYSNYKFLPTNHIGLTNYLREELIYILLNTDKEGLSHAEVNHKTIDSLMTEYNIS